MVPKPLPQSILVTPATFADDRGFLSLLFCPTVELFCPDGNLLGPPDQIVLTNTKPKTGRGLHFQDREPLLQLVSIVKGSIIECLVKRTRIDSQNPKITQSYTGRIDATHGQNSFFVPRGWAHGFFTKDEEASVLYIIWGTRNIKHEKGFNLLDPSFGFFNKQNRVPTLNKRDQSYEFLET